VKLPNYENAFIDMRKLTNYALDPTYEERGGKARVFESALGLTQDDAEFLRNTILDILRTHESRITAKTEYGQKYEVEFEMTGLNKNVARVMTAWIIRNDEDFPRLVTTYVL
jgi:hypothetical protein